MFYNLRRIFYHKYLIFIDCYCVSTVFQFTDCHRITRFDRFAFIIGIPVPAGNIAVNGLSRCKGFTAFGIIDQTNQPDTVIIFVSEFRTIKIFCFCSFGFSGL